MGAIASIEGTNNFRQHYSPAVGLVVSRTVARRLAIYATPMWLRTASGAIEHSHDAGASEDEHEHRNTAILGLGARARVLSTVYLVGEITPRVAEAAPDEVEYGFGIEKRAGKHAFSLTFTNSFGLTFAQTSRAAAPPTPCISVSTSDESSSEDRSSRAITYDAPSNRIAVLAVSLAGCDEKTTTPTSPTDLPPKFTAILLAINEVPPVTNADAAANGHGDDHAQSDARCGRHHDGWDRRLPS